MVTYFDPPIKQPRGVKHLQFEFVESIDKENIKTMLNKIHKKNKLRCLGKSI